MANDGKIGMGMVHKIDGVTIVGVEDCNGIELLRPPIDSTNYGSGGKQSVPGLLEASNIQLEIQFKPTETSHIALKNAFADKLAHVFVFEHPFSSVLTGTFNACVTKYAVTQPKEDLMMLSVELAPEAGSVVWS